MAPVLSYFATFLFLAIHVNSKPNFIFILTDDQDVTLDSMQALPNTVKLIVNEGLTFNNSFISTPICCPSRTETITGRNFHNIIDQPGPKCMYTAAQYNIFNNSHSMFQMFESNGYSTASFGKLTNDMPNYWCKDNPSLNGFSRVHCPCDYNNFYGTQYFDKYANGSTHLYEVDIAETTYQTSYIGNASIEWLEERLNDATKPLFMWIGPRYVLYPFLNDSCCLFLLIVHTDAPHFPSTPAAWYANKFADVKAPQTPNFNKSDSKKHSFVGSNPLISQNASNWIDQLYKDRLRSLLSVDDLVNEIFNLLQQFPSQFAQTFILFTSDHGYHLGQYDVPCSKQQPYEETIRIPLFLKGPNIAKNKVVNNVVGNIDILPTFLSLAGIEYDENEYDGRSWTDGILKGAQSGTESEWRSVYLTQYESVGTYGFGHCSTWFPSPNGSVCPGVNLDPPNVNEQGQEWLVDDKGTNNWRALRILNESMNAMYAEFVNASWNNDAFEQPHFFEYYDLSKDPFQLKNAYDALSKDERQNLHLLLMKYGSCKGTDCW